MNPFRVRTLNASSGQIVDLPLPLEKNSDRCSVSLEPVAGASRLQLLLTNSITSVRAEVDVALGFHSRMEFRIEWLTSGLLRIEVYPRGRLSFLPGDELYAPRLPISGLQPGTSLDLLFLIDATCQTVLSGTSRLVRRLSEPAATGSLWHSLTELASAMNSAYPDFRCGFLAFSDFDLPGRAGAADLRSGQVFQPAYTTGLLRYSTAGELAAGLHEIRAVSGGDWVDALAEAIGHCRERAGWRQKARNLIVIAGDSPGHSIQYPPPEAGCDTHARDASLEEESDRLHKDGIEVAAVYTGVTDAAHYKLRSAQKLVEHVREQYRRLASLPNWYWETENFHAEAAAALCKPPEWLARGVSYGINPRITAN